MNKKSLLFITILLLIVGFASVSTILIINGNTTISTNKNEFKNNVLFTKSFSPEPNNNEKSGVSEISADGKTITFNTGVLSSLGNTSTLYFDITNFNTQYDVNAEVSCSSNFSDYENIVNITIDPNVFTLAAGETKSGTLLVELIKSVLGEDSNGMEINFTCEITGTASERTEVGEYIAANTDNTINGSLLLNDGVNSAPVSSGSLVFFSENKKVANVSDNGYFSVSGLENGIHEVYYLEEDEVSVNSKDEIINLAIAKATFTSSTTVNQIELTCIDNKCLSNQTYSLNDINLGKTRNVTLEGDNVTFDKTYVTVPEGGNVKIVVSPFDNYYLTSITCTNGYIVTGFETGEDKTFSQEITIDNNNIENDTVCTVTTDSNKLNNLYNSLLSGGYSPTIVSNNCISIPGKSWTVGSHFGYVDNYPVITNVDVSDVQSVRVSSASSNTAYYSFYYVTIDSTTATYSGAQTFNVANNSKITIRYAWGDALASTFNIGTIYFYL